eukprot:5779831-Amphidinium_carterae.1
MQWGEVDAWKAKLPHGQVPVLILPSGEIFGQSQGDHISQHEDMLVYVTPTYSVTGPPALGFDAHEPYS